MNMTSGVAAMIIACAACSAAQAQTDDKSIGFISKSSNTITLTRDGNQSSVKQSETLFKKDDILAGRRGTATIKDGLTWKWGVKPESRVVLDWDPNGTAVLYKGALYGNSNKGPRRKVLTPSASVRPLGTAFYVEVAENGTTSVYVFDGSVSFSGLAGGSVTVTAGRASVVAVGGSPSRPAPPEQALLERAIRLSVSTEALTDLATAAPDSNFPIAANLRSTAQATRQSLQVLETDPGGQGKGE